MPLEVVSGMVSESNWKEMQARVLEALNREGGTSVKELDEIVAIARSDGEFDDQERAVLIDFIASLTGADMSAAMWARVEELIEKYDLHDDSEATIESLDEETNNSY